MVSGLSCAVLVNGSLGKMKDLRPTVWLVCKALCVTWPLLCLSFFMVSVLMRLRLRLQRHKMTVGWGGLGWLRASACMGADDRPPQVHRALALPSHARPVQDQSGCAAGSILPLSLALSCVPAARKPSVCMRCRSSRCPSPARSPTRGMTSLPVSPVRVIVAQRFQAVSVPVQLLTLNLAARRRGSVAFGTICLRWLGQTKRLGLLGRWRNTVVGRSSGSLEQGLGLGLMVVCWRLPRDGCGPVLVFVLRLGAGWDCVS